MMISLGESFIEFSERKVLDYMRARYKVQKVVHYHPRLGRLQRWYINTPEISVCLRKLLVSS